MQRELYLVEYYWCNNGDYEDRWDSNDVFGVFDTFEDACNAVQLVVDKHRYMSDYKIEDQRGDVLEFCEYNETYHDEVLTVSWWMKAGYYMSDYMQNFIIRKIVVGKFDPDIDPGL